LKKANRLTATAMAMPVASLLQDAGYHNYTAGKWHLGKQPAGTPLKNSFIYSCSRGISRVCEKYLHGQRCKRKLRALREQCSIGIKCRDHFPDNHLL